jgi:hypothetical protein
VAFIVAHATERLYFKLTGISKGKAYRGKTVVTTAITTENLTQLFINGCSSAGGLTGFHLDPAFSTLHIG